VIEGLQAPRSGGAGFLGGRGRRRGGGLGRTGGHGRPQGVEETGDERKKRREKESEERVPERPFEAGKDFRVRGRQMKRGQRSGSDDRDRAAQRESALKERAKAHAARLSGGSGESQTALGFSPPAGVRWAPS
jgi:hypothetical protein